MSSCAQSWAGIPKHGHKFTTVSNCNFRQVFGTGAHFDILLLLNAVGTGLHPLRFGWPHKLFGFHLNI